MGGPADQEDRAGRVRHAVLSSVAASRHIRTHLNGCAAQEMHCWLTVHLKIVHAGKSICSAPEALFPFALFVGYHRVLTVCS